MATCYFCHKPLDLQGKILFREECPHCASDVHVCKNCRFYDPGYANQCRETQIEPVQDKERGNYCEFFVLGQGVDGQSDDQAKAKSQLDNLFKK